MLPALLRYNLRQDSEFFRRAHSLRSSYWTFLWSDQDFSEIEQVPAVQSPSHHPSPFRFAIIVKKTVARGIERSELKRKVRRAITAALTSPLPPKQRSYAVVLIPRTKVFSASHEELVQDLRQSLNTLF